MAVDHATANDVFLALLRVQKLLLAARTAAPRLHAEVDSAAYPVLFVIERAGSVRVSDIAAAIHSDVSTVSRQVSTFVSHGLVAKEHDPRDGRAQVVRLTDAGREAIDTIQSSRAEWFQGLLAQWDERDAATFVHQLRALGDALDDNLRSRGATPPFLPSSNP